MSENQRMKKHNFDPFLIAKHTSLSIQTNFKPNHP